MHLKDLPDSWRQSLNVIYEDVKEERHQRNFETLIDSNYEIIGKMIREKEAWNECNLTLRTLANELVSQVETEFW